MQEAQERFRRVVQTELSSLLKKGISRPEAVKILLNRIVVEDYHPSDAEICMVSHKFQLGPEDATRALIVKHELARLKRCGMDSLGAIEYLTQHVKLESSCRQSMPAGVRTCSSRGKDHDQENKRDIHSTANPPQARGLNESFCQHMQANSARKRRYPSSPQQYMNIFATVSNAQEKFSPSYTAPFKKSKHSLRAAVGSSSSMNPALHFEMQRPLIASNILRDAGTLPGVNKRTRQQSEIDMVDIESGFANVSVEDKAHTRSKRKCLGFSKNSRK